MSAHLNENDAPLQTGRNKIRITKGQLFRVHAELARLQEQLRAMGNSMNKTRRVKSVQHSIHQTKRARIERNIAEKSKKEKEIMTKLRDLRRPVQQETRRIKEENNFSSMFATLSTKGGTRKNRRGLR